MLGNNRNEHRNIIVLFLILSFSIQLVSAGDNTSASINNSNSSPVLMYPAIPAPAANTTIVPSTTEDPFLILDRYENNLTPLQKRITTALLPLIDPNYPKIGMPLDQYRTMLINDRHLVPADQAVARFNISNTSGNPVGDQVFLAISVYPNSSTHILDTLVTKIHARSEELHGIEAWVDTNNLGKIASLSSVRNMKFVDYASHNGAGIPVADPVSPPEVGNTSSNAMPAPATTHPMPVPIFAGITAFAIMVCGILWCKGRQY